jgi:glucan phosphorylase
LPDAVLAAVNAASLCVSRWLGLAASWQHDPLVNIARSGRFSSDRAIRECADDIGGLTRVRV